MSQQQTIQSCIYGNIRPALDLPLFADWYMDGRLYLDQFAIETIALEDVPGMFTGREPSRATRVVVTFADIP